MAYPGYPYAATFTTSSPVPGFAPVPVPVVGVVSPIPVVGVAMTTMPVPDPFYNPGYGAPPATYGGYDAGAASYGAGPFATQYTGTSVPPPGGNNFSATPGAGPFADPQSQYATNNYGAPSAVTPYSATQTNYAGSTPSSGYGNQGYANPTATNYNPSTPTTNNYNSTATNYNPSTPSQDYSTPTTGGYGNQGYSNPTATNYNPSTPSYSSTPAADPSASSYTQTSYNAASSYSNYSSSTPAQTQAPAPATPAPATTPAQLLARVQEKEYSSDRAALIKATTVSSFTSAEVAELVKSLKYATDQKEVICQLYPKVSDKNAFSTNVIELLAYSEDKEEMKNKLAIQPDLSISSLPPPPVVVPTAPQTEAVDLLDKATQAMKLLQEEKRRVEEEVARAKREQEELRIKMQAEREKLIQEAEQQRMRQEMETQAAMHRAALEKQQVEEQRRQLEERLKQEALKAQRELGRKDTEMLQEKTFLEDQLSNKDQELKKLQDRLKRLETVDETEMAKAAMARRKLHDMDDYAPSSVSYDAIPGYGDNLDDIINSALSANKWKDV